MRKQANINILGQCGELEAPMTMEFALKAQKQGHGEITESGYFVAVYPYYGAQWCRQAIYKIEGAPELKFPSAQELLKEMEEWWDE